MRGEKQKKKEKEMSMGGQLRGTSGKPWRANNLKGGSKGTGGEGEEKCEGEKQLKLFGILRRGRKKEY